MKLNKILPIFSFVLFFVSFLFALPKFKPVKAYTLCGPFDTCVNPHYINSCYCNGDTGTCFNNGDQCGRLGTCSCTPALVCDACQPPCTPDCTGKVCGQSDGCGGTCPTTGYNTWGAWQCGACNINPGGCGTVTTQQSCTSYNLCGGSTSQNQNCGTTCNECGPHGSQTCGNWTITYDCQGPSSGCMECGPHYGAWGACTAPSFTRTRSVGYDCQAGTSQSETCYGSITGTIFDASTVDNCATLASLPKVTNTTVTATATVNHTTATSTTTDANGNYTASNLLVPDTYDLTYSVDTTKWVASPPKLLCDGLLTGISLSNQGDVMTRRIGLYRIYGGWFQVQGGDVYGNTGISDTIPATCALAANAATCNSYNSGGSYYTPLIVADPTTTLPGSAVAGSGSVTLGGGGAAAANAVISSTGWNASSQYDGKQTGYDYFVGAMAHYSAGAKQNWDGTGKPTGSASFLYQSTVTGTLTVDGTIAPGAGEKIVIFHNGDVNITGNITVPVGAYLAIIAKGNITVDPAVTTLQGVFIGSTIQVTSSGNKATEVRLNAEGTFVGWNGVILARDRGSTNNTESSEFFKFRPDFVINAPFGLRLPQIHWKEVNP